MKRPDRHNEVEMNFLDKGSLTYLFGGSKVTVGAGRLAAFWAAIPHQIIDFTGAAGYFVTTIPLAWFLQCRFPENLVQPILHGHMILEPNPAMAATDHNMFASWHRGLRQNKPDQQRIVLLEIEARFLRLALGLPGLRPGRKAHRRSAMLGKGGLSKVERIACFIAQHFAEPLTADEIGRHVGLHPNYATSLFHEAFGTALMGHVTEHRISNARRLLVTTSDKILDVALNSGFRSLSRFNEVFKQKCGCSPREYRKAHRVAL